MSFNSNGFQTIVNTTYDLFDYLAYGTGTTLDNDTSVDSEINRILYNIQLAYDTYFTLTFNIDSSTSNGNILTDWGISELSSGLVRATDNYYPMLKTNNFEVIIYITISYSGLL